MCALLPTQALLNGGHRVLSCMQGHRSLPKPHQQPQGTPALRSTSGQALDRAANTSSPAPTVQLRSAGAQLLHRSEPCCIHKFAPSDELDSLNTKTLSCRFMHLQAQRRFMSWTLCFFLKDSAMAIAWEPTILHTIFPGGFYGNLRVTFGSPQAIRGRACWRAACSGRAWATRRA